ncbi:NAD(P)/FAD-dependent oxidoreductase [Sedimentimonas flavescens]|uniref:NAD(P)/FAD-dependent oxidoreductase n=1 Tax=Sedimentimonas flavescens TaxID=2851012 RepID=UPI001C4A2FE6|nr:FAD/NAD(P)-binding oxidoreductase [Sedimentimonas flavescens]MBW0158627.1 NAD(P)/FAD-dependent oxidoreductase [Sedimentimonas flavescens]
MAGIVIVGGGQAAASMAAKLRTLGYAWEVTIIGDEPVPPYQRPPLSKAYLLGDMPLERLTLRADDWWAANNIRLMTGTRVTAIDRAARQVRMGSEVLGYDQLALCTGATPRWLPEGIGGRLPGVHVVRTLADVDAMAPEFVAGRRLVVIGGGYIGLEAAAVARKLGLTVTVIEAAPRILGRVACAETADAIRALHNARGVEVIEGTGLTRLTGTDRVTGAELADGRVIEADFVIVGIGVTPASALAEAAGLEVENGIKVDANCRTSDPAIWAAGDCASFPSGDGRIRLESVGNAIDMAETVAENMLGASRAYAPKAWFWSDQFDAKLQIAGLNAGYDQVVTRGGDGQSFWYFRTGQLIAVDALNDARAYMIGKRLIEGGKQVSPDEVASTTDLKALMK